MKKYRILLLTGAVLLLIHQVSAALPKITLNLAGGPGYLQNGEDWKTLFESTKSRWTAIGYTGNYDLSFDRWMAEANAEAIVQLTPVFSIGLGAGFLNKSWSRNPDLDYNWIGAGNIQFHNHYQFIVIPITIEAIGTLSLGRFAVSIKAGCGYYFSKFKVDITSEQSEADRPGQQGWRWTRTQNYVSDWNGAPGYHGGIGLTYRLKRRVSLFLDLIFRRAYFTKFRGTYDYQGQETWTGGSQNESLHSDKAYAWFGKQDTPGQTWRFLEFADEKPPMFDCSCPFDIDLAGVAIRIGLGIRL